MLYILWYHVVIATIKKNNKAGARDREWKDFSGLLGRGEADQRVQFGILGLGDRRLGKKK